MRMSLGDLGQMAPGESWNLGGEYGPDGVWINYNAVANPPPVGQTFASTGTTPIYNQSAGWYQWPGTSNYSWLGPGPTPMQTPATGYVGGAGSGGFVPLPPSPAPVYYQPAAPSSLVAPSAPATPSYSQIAAAQTVAGNPGTQITNVGGGAGFTMPAFFTESAVGGLPNWMLIAGAVVALMLFKK